KSLGIALPDGWFLFAHRVGGQMFFAMSPDNLVCAVHVNGIVSGPDVPFENWIMDQLKDLRFATENPGNWWSRDVLKP
ncbi:MAG: hypothetical protein KC668_30560, partial [Myxococcales bacterium]|nr:hypothetical protein [Myxococcales bacterium]